jgi:ligand-binding sensor domain-containing protein
MERRAVIALWIAMACCRCASALNPSLDISQYAHTAWRVQDGTLKARVQAIAQTPDGYLWLGTEFGLLRFDGVRFAPWEPPKGESLPSSYVLKLLVSRDGSLWIATDKGLVHWNGASLTHFHELAGQRVTSLLEDREGAIWAGSNPPAGKLCTVQSVRAQCFELSGNFGNGVVSLFEDGAGSLWVGTLAGVWRWKPGPPKLYPLPESPPQDVNQDGDGPILITTTKGMLQVVGETIKAYPIPLHGRPPRATRMLRDRDGCLWIGTPDQGLLHIHQGRTDRFVRSEGLSGEAVLDLFEDREGDL